MRIIYFALAMMVISSVNAADVQWSKGYDANCTDATERSDGTPLLAPEIASVEYYIYKEGAFPAGNPEIPPIVMVGGCKLTFIDTKLLTTGNKEAYAVTIDTEARRSVYSSPAFVFTVTKSNPKPPSGMIGTLR